LPVRSAWSRYSFVNGLDESGVDYPDEYRTAAADAVASIAAELRRREEGGEREEPPPPPPRKLSIAELSATQLAKSKPRPEPGPSVEALVASAGGVQIPEENIPAEFVRVMERVQRANAPDGDHLVASIRFKYPEGQIFRDEFVELDRVAGMTASGGLCSPPTVRYQRETISDAARPLRDALPSFNADRGGIQFNSPMHLVDILEDTTAAALTTITAATDASGGTKTVQEVACGSAQSVQVHAIASQLKFSNFTDRYDPERAEQAVRLSMSAHARLGERELLEDMRAASTVVNGGIVELGAARAWVNTIYAAAAQMRYVHRAARSVPFVAVIPEWLATVVVVDFLKQAPGDAVATGSFDGARWITEKLGDENIRPVFQRDDARTNNSQGAGGKAWTSQSGGGAALNDFPGRVETILYPEGSFLFLDGGVLDFGITRDATLNAANRYQTFAESFEGLAFVGVASFDITTLICASGAAAALVASKCGAIGS
jgi:hypothetical protein